MSPKKLPFTSEQIKAIIQKYPTPFHIYDEVGIRKSCRDLIGVFSWAPAFKEYYAVKALPNPSILEIVKSEGLGVDCSSLAELILAEKVGFSGSEIMFTANDMPKEDLVKALELGAIINLDDITNIAFLDECGQFPKTICFRYNPGSSREGGNAIIGKPEESKYGLTREQMFEAYRQAQAKGAKHFGLHTMVASNDLNTQYFVDTAEMVFSLVAEISKELGITFEFVNLGGGIGIPYKPEQAPVDLERFSEGVRLMYHRYITDNGLASLKITMECGRFITGPHGYLVSKVLHLKHIYRDYVGLDSCMANLMRPGMYGAYHHITVMNKEHLPHDHVYDVTGGLCENNDKFAIQRSLPKIERGDIVVIHDTGAHGHAMGFNYNGKLRSAELLLQPDNSARMIRRAETLDDLFATLNF